MMEVTMTETTTGAVGSPLNRYFHHLDRGGTLGGEIAAGLGIFFLSTCGIFLHMQLIARLSISGEYAAATIPQIAANGEIYAQTYFVSMLIAFLGSLLMGLVARLPLVQVSGLGLSTVLISTLGVGTGLTYYNLLFLCFVSSLIYTVLVSVPGLRGVVFHALPAPVRKALPAAMGLLMAFVAIQLTGLVRVNSSAIPAYGTAAALEGAGQSVSMGGLVGFSSFSYATDRFHPLLLVCTLAVLVTFVAYLLLHRSRRPYLYALLIGTAFFLVVSICAVCIDYKTFHFSLDSLWGRLWMVGSEDAMHLHLPTILQNLSIGRIFTEGADLSAYTASGGSVPLLFLTGLLTFLFAGMYDAQGTLLAVGTSGDSEKDMRAALVCHAAINVAAPLLGAGPVEIGKASYAGHRDGARSGIASIVAAIGFLLAMFVWVVPVLFMTVPSYELTFNLFGHYGKVFQLLSECGFAVADAVMVIVGLSMAVKSMDIDWKEPAQAIPLLTTVAGTFFLSNLACGVAAGTIAYLVIAATTDRRKLTPGNLAYGAISLVLLILTASL